MIALTQLSIKELQLGIKNKNYSVWEVINSFQQNLKKLESKIGAFIYTLTDENIKERIKNLNSGGHQLLGIPFSLKDSYSTKNVQTTAGSKVLSGYIPPYNATVYQRLNDEGAVLLGKNSQDSWGHGSASENTDFTVPKNPWDLTRVAGGSSGGSAAAIAAGMVAFAIGEDTGGSIRNPASFCNVTGLKVTYGRVSRYGTLAYASSLDTVGPMAKSVEDIAIILSIIAGNDPYDATSSPTTVPNYYQSLETGIKNKIIGVPKEFFQKGTDMEVINKVKQAIKELQKIGTKVIDVTIPSIDVGVAAYYLLAPSETSSNLARYDGIRYGQGRENFTKETMRRILIGTYALSAGFYDAYYKKSLKVRSLIRIDYENAFKKCDLLIGPVSPHPAPKFGELINDPVKMMLSDLYTLTQNIAGIPSLALPCGFTQSGLPIGMQIMGKMFDEASILQAGFAYQQVTGWHKQKPKL